MTPLTPVITAHWDVPDYFTLEGYRRHGGYAALPKALGMDPDAIIGTVKDTGLRGRGGAGFPTGLKWSFVPQNDGKPHYLVVNADESEPGACKDVPIMMANPHALIEGVIISSYAIRANHAFIYIRGEVPQAIRRVATAIAEAERAGLVGDNILGSGFSLRITVHSGAGAYICGEETALLDSLEGYRGQPRLKPPFPATHGIYEAPLGITMRELLDYAGGVVGGDGTVKFWIPGGSSVPMLTADHLDTPLTYEAMAEAGTMLGTGTPMVFNSTISVVKAVTRWLEFYKHESCGKCTPCREGTYWITGVLERFEHGHGTDADMDLLVEVCGNIAGRSFCALGDAAATPYPAALKYFRDEFEAATHTPVDEAFPPAASYVFGEVAAR
jgi:NADH-quinone oxidoreductase subunit F